MGTKAAPNSGKKWTGTDEARVVNAAKRNVDTTKIANDLGRSEAAIRSKASDLNVSLRPNDK